MVLCCTIALLVTACGSRLSNDQLATGGGTGGDGQAASSGTGVNGAGITKGSGGPKIGTLDVPCGKGTPKAPPAGTIGVTKDAIKIAVISDRVAAVKVPTASIEESMQAFVDFCNGFGGINGRKLELTKIDSKLFSQLEATKEACADNVFAIVGSGSVTDNQGAQAMVDCKLIEVPGYTVTAAKSLSDRLVAPIPNPTDHFNIGPALFMKKEHPKAIKKAAIIHGGIEAVDVQADRIKRAYEAQGYTFIYDKRTGVIQENYTSEVADMKSKGVEYVTGVSATSETVKMLRDMKTQGFKPEVIDLGQQYYDPDLLKEPGAEGAFVLLNTVPFEEKDQSKALQAYLAAYDKVDSAGKPEPTSLGVQSFSAGLLWATAVKAAGDELTRDRVLVELHKIKNWDGGGLHFPADPGDNKVNSCFMYSEVKDAKFVRYYPKKPLSFDCGGAKFDFSLKRDYGGGAKAAKGS
jgi:ABC-type branched-subunit amino acid transport system substrate-binding protein